ncbi:MAG TPA: hypothetical protein PK539_00600 [Candidatus Paceibacterota bacterium]|nr:hypothetical protein [Candidatus Paceibacterota bacterium]
MRKRLFILLGVVTVLVMFSHISTQGISVAHAATAATSTIASQIAAHDAQMTALNQQIVKYETEITQAGADKATLQNAINTLNLQRKKVEAQISATQHQVNVTGLQIQQLGSNILDIQNKIQTDQAALSEDMRSLQETGAQPLLMQLFSATDFATIWSNADAVLQVQSAVQKQTDALQTQQNALTAAEKATQQKKYALLSQRNTLTSQQTDLIHTKQTKARLLAETSAKESTYQTLLTRAKTELSSFSSFTANAGGAGLLTHQTSCDSWGCYYNQRDAAWGNDSLDGTKYTMKSDGCLVTAMAMVMTHYGYRNVTPVTINSDPGNFAAYYPAYLLLTIHVNGVSATRKAAYIDSTLVTGNPVIVGVRAYGGTHYVVLVSGSKGHYVMRDPYIPNGNDVSFSSHYTMGEIFGVRRVVVS